MVRDARLIFSMKHNLYALTLANSLVIRLILTNKTLRLKETSVLNEPTFAVEVYSNSVEYIQKQKFNIVLFIQIKNKNM